MKVAMARTQEMELEVAENKHINIVSFLSVIFFKQPPSDRICTNRCRVYF